MVAHAPLILTEQVREQFAALRLAAAKRPIHMPTLLEAMKTEVGKVAHMAQMTAQSVEIPGPWPFLVTYSIETGHPCGHCRHMSMSVLRAGRVPNPTGVWMIADELGFYGGLDRCVTWPEELRQGTAINVVQPIPAAIFNDAERMRA